MMPGSPRRIMHQSNPGVRRLRLSHPSIHLPRSVYLPSINTGALALSKFSLGAKKSSFAQSTAPPTRSEARSTNSVKSISSHKKAQSQPQRAQSALQPNSETKSTPTRDLIHNKFSDLESWSAEVD